MVRAPASKHTVPISLASQLVRLAKRWDVNATDLLSGVALDAKTIEDPSERLPVATMCSLLDRARTLTAEPGLGYYLGLQMRVTLYGYLGFLWLCAPTIGEALNLGVRFAEMFSSALVMTLRTHRNIVSLEFEECADLGSVRDIVLISMMMGMRELGRALTGRDTGGSADFTFPRPAYHGRFAHLALPSRFDQPANRLQFDAAVMQYPILTADPVALRLAQLQCESAMDAMRIGASLGHRVRSLLWKDEGSESLHQIAAKLDLSSRTLRRRLAREGTPFRSLVNESRRDQALMLLRLRQVPIEVVARRLGYASASSFVRACHRWTGKTPAQYRRQIGAG